jgi:hypothetical protein
MYEPRKYFSGLSKTRKAQRRREIKKYGSMSWKNPKAYVGFRTDRGVKTRKSGYTAEWKKLYPEAKSLEEKSRVSGVPVKVLKESYNRGMAAWRTGHRPGATQQQWGYARVNSLLMCGKTFNSTDSDIVRKARKTSKAARRWWKDC